MMTAIDGSPYGQTDTGAVYTQAAALLNDEFDTSSTPHNFCPDCEHTPCVAGGRSYCTARPRFTNAWAIKQEIYELARRQGFSNPLLRPLEDAVYEVFRAACNERDLFADDYLRSLAAIRADLREAGQS